MNDQPAIIERKPPVENIKRWPISALLPYARNPKTHPAKQIELIADSMNRFGQAQLVLIDGDDGPAKGEIIAGHGRVLAAEKLGWNTVMVGEAIGWADDEKRAYRLIDNELGSEHLAPYDLELLKLEYDQLRLDNFNLPLLGFDDVRLRHFGLVEPGEEGERGNLLHLADVTVKEPTHQVEHGDHYRLSGRHHLLCVGVIKDWPIWSPLLVGDDALFCPYPGVFVPFSERAKDAKLIMVQPDPYIAGHILDRMVELLGKEAVVKQ